MAPSTANVDCIVVNGAKTFLDKGIATFKNEQTNSPNNAQINLPDLITVEYVFQ